MVTRIPQKRPFLRLSILGHIPEGDTVAHEQVLDQIIGFLGPCLYQAFDPNFARFRPQFMVNCQWKKQWRVIEWNRGDSFESSKRLSKLGKDVLSSLQKTVRPSLTLPTSARIGKYLAKNTPVDDVIIYAMAGQEYKPVKPAGLLHRFHHILESARQESGADPDLIILPGRSANYDLVSHLRTFVNTRFFLAFPFELRFGQEQWEDLWSALIYQTDLSKDNVGISVLEQTYDKPGAATLFDLQAWEQLQQSIEVLAGEVLSMTLKAPTLDATLLLRVARTVLESVVEPGLDPDLGEFTHSLREIHFPTDMSGHIETVETNLAAAVQTTAPKENPRASGVRFNFPQNKIEFLEYMKWTKDSNWKRFILLISKGLEIAELR